MPRAPDDGVGGAVGLGARAREDRPLSTRSQWPVLLAAALVCFGLAEGAVRFVGEFGPDGQFIFRDRVIRPRVLPIRSAGEKLERYLTSADSTFVYHRVLGWIPRPSSRTADGLYAYDEHGIRREGSRRPRPDADDALRIAVFGDSFTHGDEVPYRDTFPALLEARIEASGRRARVTNVGVPGYGMDQALLRFREQGALARPQVVVFGFQRENVRRNLNLIRPLYHTRTGLPFAKPRFAVENGALVLVNVPVLPFDRVVATLRAIDAWDLVRYERFYDPRDFAKPAWRRSKLAAVAADLLAGPPFAANAEEEVRVALALVRSFEAEVRARGAAFVVVHLPTRDDLKRLAAGREILWRELLEQMDDRHGVVRPEQRLIDAAPDGDPARLFGPFHYARPAHEVVAEMLYERLTASAAAAPKR
jgi:hypothetical protein